MPAKTYRDDGKTYKVGIITSDKRSQDLRDYKTHVAMTWPLTWEIMAEMSALPRGMQVNAQRHADLRLMHLELARLQVLLVPHGLLVASWQKMCAVNDFTVPVNGLPHPFLVLEYTHPTCAQTPSPEDATH